MDRRLTESIWCTGKDSNLRTSLGGTDLQSVGFNHSPTCAKNPGRCGRCSVQQTTVQERRNRSTEKPADQSILLSQYRETKARAKDTAKITTRRKISEWSVFWKNLLRRYRVRRTAGKLSACYRSLELAKGFEPPTP